MDRFDCRPGAIASVIASLLCGSAFGQGYWRFEETGGIAVLDSGPHGLGGTLNALPARTAVVAANPVPQNDLANGQSLDLGWIDTSNGGFVAIDDPTGWLTMGNESFTIEAWVRLDQLGDTVDANGRQWLCMKKPDSSVDAELDFAFLVQAGPLGTTGNELAFRYGDSASQFTLVSTLEITDLNWHFVSVAYDRDAGELRFGLDGAFETVPLTKPDVFEYGIPILSTGPLTVGAHQTGAGLYNQFLRGTIDELRISRGFLPAAVLLDTVWQDCNTNGLPDPDDIASGYSGDCNGNFIPDECDIAGGFSDDCNLDGIPDECQLGLEPAAYRRDGGTYDATVQSEGQYTAWLERFVVQDGKSLITHVDVLLSEIGLGTNFTVYVWSDPNGDGDPTDAQALSSVSSTVTPTMAAQLNRFDVPDVDVGPDGTSFFVGVVMEGALETACVIDFRPPHVFGVSWVIGTSVPVDPNDLSANAVEFAPIETSFPGNWVLRAVSATGADYGDCNGNGVPDSCDIDSGFSDDVNMNGVPDECEFVGTYFVPDTFVSIQAGVSGAPDGSTIIVRPGEYHENINFFGKAIELRSELGAEVTTINGGGAAPVVSFVSTEGPDSIIDGFTLTNGVGLPNWGGGGVFAQRSAPTILNNIVDGNVTLGFGGGIFVWGNTQLVTIRGNTVSNNYAARYGGGVVAWSDNSEALIEGNLINNNIAEENGGGVFIFNTWFALFDNEIRSNRARSHGGGVFVQGSTPISPSYIASNHIWINVAMDQGGGVFLVTAGDVEVTNNLFQGNAARLGGALVAIEGSQALVNNTIVGNTATQGYGGVVVSSSVADVSVANSIIRGNSSPDAEPNLSVLAGSGTPSVSYSNIAGGWPGVGNIDTDPLYVNPAGGDYALAPGSPCIDAGDSTVPQLDFFPDDLAGERRKVNDPDTSDTGVADGSGHVVDMGAYEFQPEFCEADLTSQNAPVGDPNYGVPDGLVTAADLQYYVNAWVAGDLAIADVTTQNAPVGDPNYGVPDGLVTAVDIQYYVNLWLMGCP